MKLNSTTNKPITAFAYDQSIESEQNEISRIIAFFPSHCSERIQCEQSAFLIALNQFSATFISQKIRKKIQKKKKKSLTNEEEEEEGDSEEEEEENNGDEFIGAKANGKYYCAIQLPIKTKEDDGGDVFCALVISEREIEEKWKHFGCLRYLRDVLKVNVREKMEEYISSSNRSNSSHSDCDVKEELRRLIERLGMKLVAGERNEEEEDEEEEEDTTTITTNNNGIAYVVEERNNKEEKFKVTKTSGGEKSLTKLSKRESMKMRDEIEDFMEQEQEASKDYDDRNASIIDRATRPGHDAWLWARVNAERTKRVFLVSENEEIQTLLDARDVIEEVALEVL